MADDDFIDENELQEAFELLRRTPRADVERAIQELRRGLQERQGIVNITASGSSKFSGTADLQVVGSQALVSTPAEN